MYGSHSKYGTFGDLALYKYWSTRFLVFKIFQLFSIHTPWIYEWLKLFDDEYQTCPIYEIHLYLPKTIGIDSPTYNHTTCASTCTHPRSGRPSCTATCSEVERTLLLRGSDIPIKSSFCLATNLFVNDVCRYQYYLNYREQFKTFLSCYSEWNECQQQFTERLR